MTDVPAEPMRVDSADAKLVVAAMPVDAVTIFDRDLRFVAVGGVGAEALGLDPAAMEGRTLQEIFSPQAVAQVELPYRAALSGRSSTVELAQGDLWLLLRVAPFRDAAGGVIGGIVAVQDISELRQRERDLREAQARFRTAFDHAPTGVALVGLDGRLTEANAALADLLGYEPEALVGQTLAAITHPDDIDLDLAQLARLRAGELRSYQMEKRYRRRDGSFVVGMLSAALVRDGDGTPLHFVGQVEDITSRKVADERLRYLAEHDPLTGLVNRATFDRQVQAQLERQDRAEDACSLLMIDLDDFKRINDTFGHSCGDAVLRQVATVILERVRAGDVAARIGGDEFAVLLRGTGAATASVVARSVAAAIAAAAVPVGEGFVTVNASVGVAPLRRPGSIADADAAMYEAKRLGGNRTASF